MKHKVRLFLDTEIVDKLNTLRKLDETMSDVAEKIIKQYKAKK